MKALMTHLCTPKETITVTDMAMDMATTDTDMDMETTDLDMDMATTDMDMDMATMVKATTEIHGVMTRHTMIRTGRHTRTVYMTRLTTSPTTVIIISPIQQTTVNLITVMLKNTEQVEAEAMAVTTP